MSKPNRYDVAKVVGELSPATGPGVAEALGVDADSTRLKNAFENASKHGLIERRAPVSDTDTARWEISEKGRRKVAAKA
jgi:ribosomal protein L11 methylase PrmA